MHQFLLRDEHTPTPFSVDCMIAVRHAQRAHAKVFVDEIGDVKAKLSHEKCVCTHAKLSERIQRDPAHVKEQLALLFADFKRKMLRTNNCGARYPERRRFCIFVDRRHGAHTYDEVVVFSPPNNTNRLNCARGADHVPQAMSQMSRQCLIPDVGYDEGAGLVVASKVGRPIHSGSDVSGQLLTFSFHVESSKEMRVYLSWCGLQMRFYPQDVVELLPTMFGKNRLTLEFQNSDEAKRCVDGLRMVRDPYFEHFYRHLCAPKEFPSRKYDAWLCYFDAERLVTSYLRHSKAYAVKEVEVVSHMIRAYLCYF